MLASQQDAERLAALDAQQQALATEGQGYAAGDMPPDAATQQDFAQRVQGLGEAKSQILARRSGFDPAAVKKQAQADIEAIKSGDLSTLKPGQLTRAATVATGRAPTDYLRADGQPAAVERAASDFMEGLKGGDEPRMLSGLNAMFAPQLRKGIGQPSPHGGTIVAKQIVNLVPAPGSDPNDPKVIPTLRVFINSGKNFRGPVPEGTPEGATGHYDAPLTENRSSDPNDKVKAIGMKEAMDYIGHQMSFVELMNRPEAQQLLQGDQQAGDFNPQEYLSALSQVGVKKPEQSVTMTSIPAGGSVLQSVKDKRGNVSNTIIQGNEKPAPPNKQEEVLQAKLDAIDEDGDLSPKEKKAAKLAVLSGIKPGKYAGTLGSAAPATGGGGKPGDTSKSDDKRIGRALQSLKEDRLDLEKRKEVVLAEYKADIDGEGPKARATAKAAYDTKMAKLSEEDAGLKRKMQAIDESVGLGDAKPAPGAKPAAAGGKQPTVIKFDKNGNRVTN